MVKRRQRRLAPSTIPELFGGGAGALLVLALNPLLLSTWNRLNVAAAEVRSNVFLEAESQIPESYADADCIRYNPATKDM